MYVRPPLEMSKVADVNFCVAYGVLPLDEEGLTNQHGVPVNLRHLRLASLPSITVFVGHS